MDSEICTAFMVRLRLRFPTSRRFLSIPLIHWNCPRINRPPYVPTGISITIRKILESITAWRLFSRLTPKKMDYGRSKQETFSCIAADPMAIMDLNKIPGIQPIAGYPSTQAMVCTAWAISFNGAGVGKTEQIRQ